MDGNVESPFLLLHDVGRQECISLSLSLGRASAITFLLLVSFRRGNNSVEKMFADLDHFPRKCLPSRNDASKIRGRDRSSRLRDICVITNNRSRIKLLFF